MSTIVMWASDLRAQTEFYALLFDLPEPEIQGDFVSVTSSQNLFCCTVCPMNMLPKFHSQSSLPQI